MVGILVRGWEWVWVWECTFCYVLARCSDYGRFWGGELLLIPVGWFLVTASDIGYDGFWVFG